MGSEGVGKDDDGEIDGAIGGGEDPLEGVLHDAWSRARGGE